VADELPDRDPLALLIGMLLDRQMLPGVQEVGASTGGGLR
jgi:hypothetical protein